MTYTTDKDLGLQVHEHLVSIGLETPFDAGKLVSRDNLEHHFAEIMAELGLDLDDDSLTETPKRLAKMYGKELFAGLDYSKFPKATVVENKMHYDEMLVERNIQVYSLCEHHFLPIIGRAFVAYIPKSPTDGGMVIGLSKLNRIVDFFCRRPQIQERLVAQIAETLKFLLKTDDVAVIIEAEHMCVKIRGVEDACSDTVTSRLSGAFKNDPLTRAEFIQLSKGLL